MTDRPPSSVFSALRHPGFRALWCGNLLSGAGVWVQNLALGWILSRQPNSAALLGLLGFVSLAPVLLVSFVGGTLADRADRRSILLVAQSGLMLIAVGLASLTYFQLLQPWHILAAAAVSGVLVALSSPAYQALIGDLVPREDLPRAIALNSVQFNVARIAGHALAGVAIVAIGEVGCFLFNAVTYLAIIVALLAMREASGHLKSDAMPFHLRAREGLSYVRGNRAAVRLIVGTACISLFGLPYFFLLPQFGRDVLHIDARGLGLLTASVSAGGLAGGLLATAVARRLGEAGTIVAAVLLFWLHLLGFAASGIFALSAALLVGLGFCLVVALANINAMLQLATPPAMRGRVMSLQSIATNGMAPLGCLIAGGLASFASVQIAVGTMSLVGAAAAMVVLRLPREQPDSLQSQMRVAS